MTKLGEGVSAITRDILLRLSGLLLFALVVYGVDVGSNQVGAIFRDTYDFNTAQVLQILLLFALALGTLFLRLDLLYSVLRSNQRFRISWATVAIFGSPFIVFSVMIPLGIWALDSETLAIIQAKFFQAFGRSSGIISSLLLGFGFLIAIEKKNAEYGE